MPLSANFATPTPRSQRLPRRASVLRAAGIGVAFLGWAFAAEVGRAQTSYYGLTSGDWNTPTIWSPNGTPMAVNGDSVTINISGVAITVDNGDSASAGAIILDAGSLTVSSGGSLTGDLILFGATFTIAAGGSFNGGSYLLQSGGTFALGNSVNYAQALHFDASPSANFIAVDGTDSATLSGILNDQGGTPGNGFTKTGTGTLVLSNANTYSGGTVLSAGTIQIGNAAALGTGTLTFDGTGTTLQFGGFYTVANAITLTTSGTIDTNGNNGILNGVIGGPGGLTKEGSGTLILSDADTYTGGTTITGGTLALAGGGSLSSSGSVSVGAGATFDISELTTNVTIGDLSGSGTVALGARTLIIDTSDSTTFSGTITDGGINGGSGGSLTKQGAGTLILSGANTYTGGTILNTGTIQVQNNSALGTGTLTLNGPDTTLQFGASSLSLANGIILSNDGIIDTNGNNGTLSGLISGSSSLTKFGTGTLTLTNANTYGGGTVIYAGTLALSGTGSLLSNGAVNVVSGATFDITNSSSLTQTIGALSGAGEVTLGNNSLIVDTAGTSTFSGQIIGNGGLIKEGTGTLVLSGGNTFLGGAAINAGTLEVDGSMALASNFVVNNGGTLRGSGSLGATTVTSGGTLAAGSASALGTLTFSELALQTGSTTILRVNSATSHDEIVSTGTLSLGGNLSLTLGGGLLNGDTVTLIQAGTLIGSFADQTVTNNLNNALTFSLATITGAGGTVSVDVTAIQQSFLPFSQNPNQLAVANLLNSVVGDPRESALISALNALPGTSLPAAFTEISPIQQTAVAMTSLNVSRANFGTLENRLSAVRSGSNGLSLSQFNLIDQNIPAASLIAGTDLPTNVKAFTPAPDNRWGFFAAADGDFGDINGGSLSPDSSYHGAGFTLGSDYRVTPALALGFAAGYDWNKTDFDNSGSNVVANSIRFGPYATWKDKTGDWIDGTLGGAYHWYESARDTIGGMADSHSNGTEFDTSLKYGHDFQAGAWTLTPTFGFDYLHLNIGDYTESGSLAPLTVDEQNADSFRSNLGGTVAHAFQWKGVAWNPYVQAGWAHEFLDAADAVSARFASGAGDVFTTQGQSIGHDSATFGAGLQATLTDAVTANLSYSGEANGQYQDHSFDVSVRVQF